MLSPELLEQVNNFITENAQLGYTAKEEFIQDAIRFRLASLSEEKLPVHNPKKGRSKP